MKKLIYLLLSIVMVLSTINILDIKTYAGSSSTTYIDINGNEKYVPATKFPKKTINDEKYGDYICLGEANKTTWYYIENITLEQGCRFVVVFGDVNLILCDGATLNIPSDEYAGIIIASDSTLTIYGQSNQTGTLNVHSSDNAFTVNDSLVINGGNVNVYGEGDIGIGLYMTGSDSETIVNGGTLTVYGGSSTSEKYDGEVAIYNGKLTVNGGTLIAVGGVGVTSVNDGIDNCTLTIADKMMIEAGEDEDKVLKITNDDKLSTNLVGKRYVKISMAKKDEVYLDLDSSTTDILDTKELEQKYNLQVNETKTDTSKVKLTWEIKDINATRTDNKVWDTENLCWNTSSSTSISQEGYAKFTFENYSSMKIDASVTFESEFNPEVVFDKDTGEDGIITIDTANGNSDYTKDNIPKGTISVTVTPDENDFKQLNATSSATLYGTYTIKIEESTNCFASGTKITMADGTLKNIEDVIEGDEVLSFNHETGKYEAKAIYCAYKGEYTKCAFTLHFDNNTTLSIVGGHDLFEEESLKYVVISEDNVNDYVGKHFYSADDNKFVKLVSVTYETVQTKFYSLYTKVNKNCIANGMLSVGDDVGELLNIYKFNHDLTADLTQLAKDIETYGLFEYQQNDRYSYEVYDAFRLKYMYIVVGKGFCTQEYFNERLEAALAY